MVDSVCDTLYNTCINVSACGLDLVEEIADIYRDVSDLDCPEQTACDVILDALLAAKEHKADCIPTNLLPAIIAADPDGFAIYYGFEPGELYATIVYDSEDDGAAAMEIPADELGVTGGVSGISRAFGCDVPIFEIAPSDVKVDPKRFSELIGKMLKSKLTPKDGTFTLHWRNGDTVEFGQEFRAYSAGESGTKVHTVDAVNIQTSKDGKVQAWIYHDNTGYSLSVCEPVRDDSCFTMTTTYNDAPYKSGKFVCHRCKAEFELNDVTYCPKCGRRVL